MARCGAIVTAATVLLSLLPLGCSEDGPTRPDGGSASTDSIPPATVLDLVAEPVTPTSVLLTWTAVGDDARDGEASEYDVRRSFWHKMIVQGGFWDSSVPISQSLVPGKQGEPQCLLVTGLEPDTLYYFGVRVADEVPNWSAVSNVASYRTEQDEPVLGAYDAEFLALRLSGELLAPPELVERIARDLAAVRARYPYMKTIGVLTHWYAGRIYVMLDDDAWNEFQQGEYHGLDELNAEYGPVDVTVASEPSHYLLLEFDQAYNSMLLAEVYDEAAGVAWAQAAGLIGDGSDIKCSELGTYAFVKAWGDCLNGCAFHHYWVFEVEDCQVRLLDEYGYPLPVASTAAGGGAF